MADAFQNIGKNTPNLCRGNQPDFDDILTWASTAETNQIEALFDYVVASTALTARPVMPMPELVPAALTFYRVGRLLEVLIERPSRGAHEQFAVAACIEALLDEFGHIGPNRLRIDTKPLNASDLSSGAGGDIVIRRGNRPEEAIEISASGWRAKLPQAVAAISANDLPRAHVIADDRAGEALLSPELETLGADVSVIDVRAFMRTLVAIMRKRARERTLIRLYEHLVRHQPDVELVNRYVDLLRQHGVTV